MKKENHAQCKFDHCFMTMSSSGSVIMASFSLIDQLLTRRMCIMSSIFNLQAGNILNN